MQPPQTKSLDEIKCEKQGGNKMNNTPELNIKAGSIFVAVWNNKGQNKDGQETTYQTVSFERRYVDKEDNWKSTNQLRANDIPKAIVALQKAYEHLVLTEGQGERT